MPDQDENWAAVDEYIAKKLLGKDAAPSAALAANAAGGLPDIDVSPPQGKFLHLLTLLSGTRALFDYISNEPRLTATAIQTVGSKKWDGFLLAIVDAAGA